jgi:tRNA pseudouridine synthase 10
MLALCQICNEANGSAFARGDCYICRGGALEVERMTDEAAALIKKEDASGFSLSTMIPKEWLIREEDAWDVRGGQSIKDFINRKIARELQTVTGLPYENEADCRMVFDFARGTVSLERNDLFIFGRYKKLVQGLSQSRWLCSHCNGKGCDACGGKGKNYESVEERVGEPLKNATRADGYVMHASGREDVDATNTAGRAFVLMLANPRKRALDLERASVEIAESGEVSVSGLRIVGRPFVEVVTESHFDKTYEAYVEFGKPLTAEDLACIKEMEEKTLAQQTPQRVAHRRADLVRYRKVKRLEILSTAGGRAVLRITAEAGTYIKELISGDDGRTQPSIAELLKTDAKCTKLVVEQIEDGFLDLCLKAQVTPLRRILPGSNDTPDKSYR